MKSRVQPKQVYSCLVGMLMLGAVSTWAATVTVTVTVLEPPSCIINDDRPIEVNFGEVLTTRVDGSHYRMPVVYSLSCKGAPSNAMKLQMQGSGAAFDSTVLRTSNAGLGIQLQQGSSKLAMNSWLNFTYPNVPSLWAVPVKQSGVTLSGGSFSAGATLKVAYQ